MITHYDTETTHTLNFPDNSVFIFYIRRSNGPRRLVYSGKSAQSAFDRYSSFKVFSRDYKYLFFIDPQHPNQEHKIKGETGRGERTTMNRIKRAKENYERSPLYTIDNFPKTIMTSLKDSLTTFTDKDYRSIGCQKAALFIMAYFSNLPTEEQHKILSRGEKELMEHKIKSGLNNTKKAKEYFLGKLVKEEDDDLL